MKHSKASGAEINQEETQIFRFTGAQKDESQELQEKIRDKVDIMGATFCNNKESETKENLKKPLKTLNALIDQPHHKQRRLMGNVVQLHTYVYRKIWHSAWLIDSQCTAFIYS